MMDLAVVAEKLRLFDTEMVMAGGAATAKGCDDDDLSRRHLDPNRYMTGRSGDDNWSRGGGNEALIVLSV